MLPGARNVRLTWGICLGLALVTLVAFLGVFSCKFVVCDDPAYVFSNPHVEAGLTWDNVGWAFTTRHCNNWHPITWLSLMLDDDLYGLSSAGFHATNLALHIANTVLLFLLLQRMTGARWRSAFVAALFAWHPLHVESVAWVSERKDVLSTLFWLFTLGAYVRYAEKPGLARYWPVPLLFALGLMAKPMLVTLPFLLLLLDFWPLRRVPPTLKVCGREFRLAETPEQTHFVRSSVGRLVAEKAPLLVLSAVSSAVTLWAQTKAIDTAVPFEVRFLNAALSYLRYLVKTVWPARLYLSYPMPHGWPISYPLMAILVVGCLSVLAVREARKRPYLFTGWFWFLGTLVPVIGLVEVGVQSMADRYTYVPLIGVFLMVAWWGCDLAEQWRFPPALLRTLAVAAVIACIPVTIIQVGYWKNSFTLFQHALRLNPDNFLAELELALTYEDEGQLEPALKHLLKAQKLNPSYLGFINDKIGWIQFRLGNEAAAMEAFQTALQYRWMPREAHFGLALVFENQGRSNDAIVQLQAALPAVPEVSADPAKYHRLLKDIIENMKTTPPSVVPRLSVGDER